MLLMLGTRAERVLPACVLRLVSEENVVAGWSPCGRVLHTVPTGSANVSFPGDALGRLLCLQRQEAH